ncbi:diguanylate cyclase [Marinobacter nauticus]|uniref:diguanylate cyclase n=1 Tax=Marinobacter nauticus TaxID=2743 RepID=A0A368V6X9_MARNT|nr:diguanylate cyclase (GGDEF)-like protein [Marinobacter nauticus]RCW36876.1 diguanylate cyclase (GGDEF)-like protein [Marinobacter nauticus]
MPTDSWRESIDAARDRRCDMFPLAMETPERTSYMSFTTPYLEVPNVIMGRIEAPFIERLSDMGDRPVGVVDGYAFAELLKQRYPSLQLVPVGSEQEGLRQLQNGKLAGYITTLATASYYMQSLGLADLKVIGRVPADWSLAIATRNDEPILHNIMQRLVSSLTREERENLESTWRNLRIEERVDYTRFWQILIAGLVITALLVYWNRKLGRLNRELAEANEALSRLSVTDNLTQLGNRSYFDREFPRSFQWCQRHKTGFAVAMVDADHFKKINDTWGHEAGDQCLQALADVMREHFRRETDRLSRFGGEEFIIFTSYEDASDIMDRLERFRTAVANRQCDTCQGSPIELTVSIGLAYGVPEPTGSPAEYLRQADQALYAAKGNGRNRLEARQTGRKT